MSKQEMVEVVATQKGFHHGIREVGEHFEVPKSLLGPKAWFKQVGSTAKQDNPEQNQNSGTPNPYDRMNKDELIQTAQSLGITLSGQETKAQIVELLTTE